MVLINDPRDNYREYNVSFHIHFPKDKKKEKFGLEELVISAFNSKPTRHFIILAGTSNKERISDNEYFEFLRKMKDKKEGGKLLKYLEERLKNSNNVRKRKSPEENINVDYIEASANDYLVKFSFYSKSIGGKGVGESIDIYLVKGMEIHLGKNNPPHTLAFLYDGTIGDIVKEYRDKTKEYTGDMIKELKEKNSIVIMAHPFMSFAYGVDEETLTNLLKSEETKPHAIEWNCQIPRVFDYFGFIFPYRNKVIKYSKDHSIPFVVGVDSVLADINSGGYSIMRLNPKNPKELRESFRMVLTREAMEKGYLKNVLKSISYSSFLANLWDVVRVNSKRLIKKFGLSQDKGKDF